MTNTNIYVGNLLYATTETQLVTFFKEWGEVERATLVYDRETGKPRGFAFIEMPHASEAAVAVANAHGTELNGRPLTVNHARPRGSGSDGGDTERHPNAHPSPHHHDLHHHTAPDTLQQHAEPVRRSGGYTNHLYL